jgi:DNA polymerase alpha subunit B
VLGRLCPSLPRAVAGVEEDFESDGRGYPALSRENIVLESSRLVGAGSRTPLVFPERTTVRTPEGRVAFERAGLFPGMVVGLLGKNGGAGKFVVDEVLLVSAGSCGRGELLPLMPANLQPPALPHASTDAADLLTHQHDAARLASGPMSLLVASGPYSAESDLAFGPWHRLMDAVEEERPDVFLLLGPFLSLSHPALLAPGQDLLPEEIFKAHISERLARLEKTAPRTTVILVPSTKDAASKHAAWPQPMLDKKDAALGIPKVRIRSAFLVSPSLQFA